MCLECLPPVWRFPDTIRVTSPSIPSRAQVRVAVVAGVVPDEFDLAKSGREPPVDALADPVDLVALDDLKAVEAVRIALVYDPSGLPPGASPTDVAVAVETEDGWGATRVDGGFRGDDGNGGVERPTAGVDGGGGIRR